MAKAFVIITSEKIRYLVSEKTRDDLFDAIQQGEKYYIVQGDMIPLNITPTVISIERFYQQECERLKSKGQKLCKRCLKVCDISCGCPCKESREKDDAFIASALPIQILNLVERKLSILPSRSQARLPQNKIQSQ